MYRITLIKYTFKNGKHSAEHCEKYVDDIEVFRSELLRQDPKYKQINFIYDIFEDEHQGNNPEH